MYSDSNILKYSDSTSSSETDENPGISEWIQKSVNTCKFLCNDFVMF